MTLLKRVLANPPADPNNLPVPVDAQGKPLYTVAHPPAFFQTLGSTHVEAQSMVAVGQTIHLQQLTKLLQQMSALSSYAHELFSDLTTSVQSTSKRMSALRKKVVAIQQLLPTVEKKMAAQACTWQLGSERHEWKLAPQMEQQLFSKQSANPSISSIYAEQCLLPPTLVQLDKFRDDKQTSMKFYSYPQYFVEQWRLLMEKEQQARKKKRKEKKATGDHAKKAVVVADLAVKRYNKAGELIENDPSQQQNNNDLQSTMALDTHQPQQSTQNISINVQNAAVTYSSDTMPATDASAPLSVHTKRDSIVPSMGEQGSPPIVSDNTAMSSEPTSPFGDVLYEAQVPELETDEPRQLMVPVVEEQSDRPATIYDMPALSIPASPMDILPPVSAAPMPPPAPAFVVPGAPPAAPGGPPPPPMPPAADPVFNPSSFAAGLSNLKPRDSRQLAQLPPPKLDTRSSMMDNIKGGGFSLKKTQFVPKPKVAEAKGGNDVASILMRRIALEMSDSDDDDAGGEGEEKDDDWD